MTTFSYSTYLSLTNQVLTELNEVNLTSSNFASAVGFQAVAKNAVNKAVRDINTYWSEWPFNHVSTTQVLTIGVPTYNLPAACKNVDWDTFYIQKDLGLSTPQNAIYLPKISYDDYVQKFKWNDMNADSSSYSVPRYVVRSQNSEFIMSPYPDQAYTVAYEYWTSNSDMSAYSDSCSVPNLWDHVTINAAMYYCYKFRENLEAASGAEDKFKDNLKYMRFIYISDYDRVTDRRNGPMFYMRS